MLVSVIIPAYNAERTLDECITACRNQTWPETEIIVVDDGSTDTTAQIAQSHAVRYLRQENGGPAKARNRGAAEAHGEFVAFVDADCVPEPDWIDALLTGFVTDDTVGVGGTYGIANPENLLARIIHEEIRVRHERFGDTVDFLGSFNVAYRKSAFEAAGGFDEGFRIASAEDNDLAYRLLDRGGVLRFRPAAAVKHYHPERLGAYLLTQMRHGFWRMRLYAKHPKRMRGDHYADWFELARPPMMIVLLAMTPWVLYYATAPRAALAPLFAFWLLGTTIVGLSRFTEQRNIIAERARVKVKTRYDVLMAFRDLARGIGLVRGVWTFVVLGKETAG